jgi:hypothetical protein
MAARRLIPRRNQAGAAYARRRSSNANGLRGWNSAGVQEICGTFKGIIFPDVSEFESYMPSQAVRSLEAMGSEKSARSDGTPAPA